MNSMHHHYVYMFEVRWRLAFTGNELSYSLSVLNIKQKVDAIHRDHIVMHQIPSYTEQQ